MLFLLVITWHSEFISLTILRKLFRCFFSLFEFSCKCPQWRRRRMIWKIWIDCGGLVMQSHRYTQYSAKSVVSVIVRFYSFVLFFSVEFLCPDGMGWIAVFSGVETGDILPRRNRLGMHSLWSLAISRRAQDSAFSSNMKPFRWVVISFLPHEEKDRFFFMIFFMIF